MSKSSELQEGPGRVAAKDPARAASLQLLIAIARAFKAIEARVRPHLAGRGLGMTEFAVLEVLLHKGSMPLSQLASQILVTGASTTYAVKKLEERGLMRRQPSPDDQRVVLGELTPAGRKLIRGVFAEHTEHLHSALGGLSDEEKHAVTQMMFKLRRHAESGSASARRSRRR